MSRIDDTIDVNVPISTAYNQWTQFEEFPRFMEGVDRVVQLDDETLEWTATIAGQTRQWRARIVDQVPDERIAWISTNGARNDGIVTFRPLDGGRTRINLAIDMDPDGAVENLGDALGVVDGRVRGDLERFRDFIEQRGAETGAWRGTIPADDTADVPVHGRPGVAGTTRSPEGSWPPIGSAPLPEGDRVAPTPLPDVDEEATGRGFAEGQADPDVTRRTRTKGAGFATGMTEPAAYPATAEPETDPATAQASMYPDTAQANEATIPEATIPDPLLRGPAR